MRSEMDRFSRWHDYKVQVYTDSSKDGARDNSWVARGINAMHCGLLHDWTKRREALPGLIRSVKV